MGDRGNIVMRLGKTNADDEWLYTHWRGSQIRQVVQKTLARNERHDDGSYLARMMFCELVDGNKDSTGFGMSSRITDNEYDIVVVDVPNQKVFMVRESSLVDGRLAENPEKLNEWSFAEFVEVTKFTED